MEMTTEKPTLKSEIAISVEGQNIIIFFATPDAAQDLATFGQVASWTDPHQYCLYLDTRFDRSEVIAYIKTYGKHTHP